MNRGINIFAVKRAVVEGINGDIAAIATGETIPAGIGIQYQRSIILRTANDFASRRAAASATIKLSDAHIVVEIHP